MFLPLSHGQFLFFNIKTSKIVLPEYKMYMNYKFINNRYNLDSNYKRKIFNRMLAQNFQRIQSETSDVSFLTYSYWRKT